MIQFPHRFITKVRADDVQSIFMKLAVQYDFLNEVFTVLPLDIYHDYLMARQLVRGLHFDVDTGIDLQTLIFQWAFRDLSEALLFRLSR